MDETVLLYDGDCPLCCGAASFVARHDSADRVRLLAAGTEEGTALLERHALPTACLDTLVLVESGRVYTRSTGALRVARLLGWPWKVLYAVVVVPRPLRDTVYELVARARYRLSGREAACPVPAKASITGRRPRRWRGGQNVASAPRPSGRGRSRRPG